MGTRWNRLTEAVLTSTNNLCFEQKCEKYQNFLSENFHVFGCKIFNIFEQACFRNDKVLDTAFTLHIHTLTLILYAS